MLTAARRAMAAVFALSVGGLVGESACSRSGLDVCGSRPAVGAPEAAAPEEAAAPDAPAAESGPECVAGARRCAGPTPETCIDGQWVSGATCVDQRCVSGVCTGACSPGAARCAGAGVQTCGADFEWGTAVACPPTTPFCAQGSCEGNPPSCAPGGDGLTDCGAAHESCCTSLEVPGGTFYRTYTTFFGDGGATGEADPATVTGLRLDKYDVTVGRFRQFVKAWNGGTGWTPPAGSGKHSHLNGGSGLASSGTPGKYEPGWVASDDGNLAPTDSNLACDLSYATWTPAVGTQEKLPINCVSWWEAYAFCIWDEGFLPSEAEHGYAGAGGAEQREYPWGSTDPGSDNRYAILGCDYPTFQRACSSVANIAPVGTPTLGAGKWGQLDLMGNVYEWDLDWHAVYANPCTDCAYVDPAGYRSLKGGVFNEVPLPTGGRFDETPTTRYGIIGLRCARAP